MSLETTPSSSINNKLLSRCMSSQFVKISDSCLRLFTIQAEKGSKTAEIGYIMCIMWLFGFVRLRMMEELQILGICNGFVRESIEIMLVFRKFGLYDGLRMGESAVTGFLSHTTGFPEKLNYTSGFLQSYNRDSRNAPQNYIGICFEFSAQKCVAEGSKILRHTPTKIHPKWYAYHAAKVRLYLCVPCFRKSSFTLLTSFGLHYRNNVAFERYIKI